MAARRDSDVSIVIPAFNEEMNVDETIDRVRRTLENIGPSWEIVIVDDCSTDRTAEVVARRAETEPRIRVIRNPVNLGAGTSVLIGLRSASGKIRMHNSMDLPFDPADLPRVLSLFPQSDVVVIRRIDRSAHSPWRKLTSFVHHWLVRVLFWIDVRDMNFVQAYKADVIEKLPIKARSPSFVTAELLIRARRAGFVLREVECVFHPRKRGVASYGKPRDILWALADMFSLRLEGLPPVITRSDNRTS
jgi:glycosyltransferase involved in cell wall biosynthesis